MVLWVVFPDVPVNVSVYVPAGVAPVASPVTLELELHPATVSAMKNPDANRAKRYDLLNGRRLNLSITSPQSIGRSAKPTASPQRPGVGLHDIIEPAEVVTLIWSWPALVPFRVTEGLAGVQVAFVGAPVQETVTA